MSELNSNNDGRKGPGKTILAIILAIADIVLLVVIICGAIDSKDSHSDDVAAETNWSEERVAVERDFESKQEFDSEPEPVEEPKQPEVSDSVMNEESKEQEALEGSETLETSGAAEASKDLEASEDLEDLEASEDLEEPSLSDFMWYFDGVYWNGIPENSSRLSDGSYLSGDWKIFIWFDHGKDSDTYWIEFGNVNLDFSDDNVNVVVKPCKLYPPSGAEPIDLTNSGFDKYNGKFSGGELNATGAGNFHITNFYTLDDGKQYAVGSIDEPDGTPTVIALVRNY